MWLITYIYSFLSNICSLNFDIILDFKTCIHKQQCAVKTGVIVGENGPPYTNIDRKWFTASEQICFIKSKQNMFFVWNKDISKWLKTFRSIQKCFKHSGTLKVGTNEPHTKPQTCRRSHYLKHVHLIVSQRLTFLCLESQRQCLCSVPQHGTYSLLGFISGISGGCR